MSKKILVIFTLLFFVIVFNGYTQRNRAANENITEAERPIYANVAETETPIERPIIDIFVQHYYSLAETGFPDIFEHSSRRIYVMPPPRIHNPEVVILQERLMELGFTRIGAVDGFYGPMTAGEVYFIKAALGFVDRYIGDFEWRPEDYSFINDEIWYSIFDPENTLLLKNLSQVRLIDFFPLEINPENSPNITNFVETQLPFTYPDWTPPWGIGSGSKTQREFYYPTWRHFFESVTISVIETREIVWTWSETIRDFTFPNGIRIRQSIVAADGPGPTVRFSIP